MREECYLWHSSFFFNLFLLTYCIYHFFSLPLQYIKVVNLMGADISNNDGRVYSNLLIIFNNLTFIFSF